MAEKYTGDILTRSSTSERASWRATLNGKPITVHISADGALWHWDKGQVTLCRSDESRTWAQKHVHNDDVENILLSCPTDTPRDKSSITGDVVRHGSRNFGSSI